MDKNQDNMETSSTKGEVAANRDTIDSTFKGIDVGGSAFTKEDRPRARSPSREDAKWTTWEGKTDVQASVKVYKSDIQVVDIKKDEKK